MRLGGTLVVFGRDRSGWGLVRVQWRRRPAEPLAADHGWRRARTRRLGTPRHVVVVGPRGGRRRGWCGVCVRL